MKRKQSSKIEFRYYKMPAGSPILPLLGQEWIRSYDCGQDEYLHFHNYLEVGYCYDGQGILSIAGEDYRFSRGQFSVIPPKYPHATISDVGVESRWEYLFIDVESVLNDVYPSESDDEIREQVICRINSGQGVHGSEKSQDMAEKIRQILELMHGTKEFYLEEAKGTLTAFLFALAREYHSDGETFRDEKIVAPISTVLDYVSDHYMEPIRIEQLAEICHISETHFRRLFLSCMDMGPLEYINLVRIQNACELLKKTDALISNVAFKCGFSTISTFNRNFKQVTGYSPLTWRKRSENLS